MDPSDSNTRIYLILATMVVAWLPIMLLAALAWPRTQTVDPLLLHAEVHARLLCALALVLAAEMKLELRVDLALRGLIGHEVVPEASREAWTRAVSRGHMRGLRVFDRVWLIVVYATLAAAYLGFVPDWALRWISSALAVSDVRWTEASIAWWWYVVVALPLLFVALGRWLYRWMLWTSLLWRLARARPMVSAAHGDRAGGLGFLRIPLDALRVFVLGLAVAIAAVWFDEIAAGRALTSTFTADLIAFFLVIAALSFAPYLALAPVLVRAREQAMVDYAGLLRRYLQRFEQRWLGADEQAHANLLGHPDLSGLADLGASAAVVEQTRSTIPTLADLRSMIVAAASPFVVVGLAYGPSAAEYVRGAIRRLLGG